MVDKLFWTSISGFDEEHFFLHIIQLLFYFILFYFILFYFICFSTFLLLSLLNQLM